MPGTLYCMACAVSMLSQLAADGHAAFKPCPLTMKSLTQAVRSAGFEVVENRSRIPVATYSQIPFASSPYDDKHLAQLRQKYELEKVVASAKDEWTAQLLLKDWVKSRIPEGNPRSVAVHALDILDRAAHGETFYCTHYAITYAECALALGWQARKLGIDRLHGRVGFGSSHHGVAEVWSNDFCKWVVIDADFNVHYEKRGIPLGAWEVRAEWLRNQGADVDRMVGAPPSAAKKKLGRVSWRFPEDETSSYFWCYINTHVLTDETRDGGRLIFPQDSANDALVWYQNHDEATQQSRLHTGYLRNTFIPTRRLEDAYWTVGIVDAMVTRASDKTLVFSLKSNCPNLVDFERSNDRASWEAIKDAKAVAWELKSGWNSLVLRTHSQGRIMGPETTLLLFLK